MKLALSGDRRCAEGEGQLSQCKWLATYLDGEDAMGWCRYHAPSVKAKIKAGQKRFWELSNRHNWPDQRIQRTVGSQ